LSGCNTATPASKSASSKACGNVTTVDNYIGLLPCPATNGAAYASAMVKKFGWASATNTLVSAAESCSDGSCSEKNNDAVK